MALSHVGERQIRIYSHFLAFPNLSSLTETNVKENGSHRTFTLYPNPFFSLLDEANSLDPILRLVARESA